MSKRLSNKTCVQCGCVYVGMAQSKFCGDQCRIKKYAAPNEAGCWLWPKNRSNGRYGIAKAGPTQPTVLAHRLAYEAFIGPIGNKLVMHKCDVMLCVNPEHLMLGTPKENTQDMCRKRRHAFGERNHNAILTEQQARGIYADKRSWREIASAYDVSKSAVMMIKTRRNWAHIHADGAS